MAKNADWLAHVPSSRLATPGEGSGVARFFLYPVSAAAVLYGALHPVRRDGQGSSVEELGSVELTQLVLLLSCAAALAIASRLTPLAATALRFGIFLLGIAFVRELDQLFDRIVHGIWKVPAVVLAAFAARYVALRWDAFLQAAARMRRSYSMGLAFAAVMVIVVMAPTIGQQALWRDVMGASYSRQVPRLVEEVTELCGYLLLAMACVESCFESRRLSSAA